uniref:CUT domain-containing protein n=1 Tax=Angiostrongylus cantonensis TaxID=6313 RepID=A0A0K0DFD3_ANGCA
MEGLDSGGLATDPLLSAALSSPLGSSREDLFLHDFARSSPHPGTLFGYFFPPSSQPYNYNVNIKYEYDLKNEDDSNESPPGHPPCSTPSEYVQSHVSQANETNFSSASFVPAYSGLEIRSPKSEKECFFNGYTNGKCDMDDESVCLPKNCSPTTNGQESLDGDEEDDGEELNTKDLAQRISAELKRYSIPQAIFAQKILCRQYADTLLISFRSQGTLSDLLRNPKPWSKLKSGRETFRRMAKWLQEPEFKRMSDLRMAGQLSSTRFCISLFASYSVSFSLSVSPFTSLFFSLCLSLSPSLCLHLFLSIVLP